MLLSLLLLPLAFAERYTLYHRHLPKGEYTSRGTVSIEEGVATFSSASDIPESDAPWYQVALDVGGNLITSSTRSCLAHSDAQLTVRLSAADRPTAIEYKPLNTPADGSCPSRSSASSDIVVVLAKPHIASSPALGAPPVIAETGEEVKPEPEKTLLQKYWLPITVVFVMMFLAGGSDDEPAKGAAKK